MRRLIWVVLAASGLWGGVWYAGATLLERTVRQRLADAAPRVVAASADVAGFPNRFDLTLTGLQVGEAGEAVWLAPFLQLFALSYKPWHLIAAFPPEQSLTLPDGTALTLASDKLRASLHVTPSTDAALKLFVVEGQGLSLRGAGPLGGLGVLNFGVRPVAGEAATYDLGLKIAGLRPDPALLASPSPGALPQGTAKLDAALFLSLSAPLDANAGESRPVPVMIDLRAARIDWGDIAFAASGRLTPDAAGLAEGQIDLTLSGWDSALSVAVAAGAMPPGVADTWSAMARGLADSGGDPGQVKLALVLRDGQMRLGPLPLGPAPRLSP